MDKEISSDTLTALGFDPQVIENNDPAEPAGCEIARVTAVYRENWRIDNGRKEVLAELLGKLRFGATSPLDFPAVGDWVIASCLEDGNESIIHRVLPRKSLLKRKTPGKQIDFQLIAANIDTAFIVQALDGDFNLRRLERYLVMVHDGGIRPVVLLSKSDLASAEVIEDRLVQIEAMMPGLNVLSFSSKIEDGPEKVNRLLRSGRTYCLLGSSGVGKTTLLNLLVGESRFRTQAVREKDGKGRHVTTGRQLIRLPSGAMVIDTPGMRELGNFSVETGLAATFDEIAALSQRCRFSDCTHQHEQGCAVIEAIEQGELAEERYQNYLKMVQESNYNQMSYLEKRKRDRQFGKMCKSIMKDKKNRR